MALLNRPLPMPQIVTGGTHFVPGVGVVDANGNVVNSGVLGPPKPNSALGVAPDATKDPQQRTTTGGPVSSTQSTSGGQLQDPLEWVKAYAQANNIKGGIDPNAEKDGTSKRIADAMKAAGYDVQYEKPDEYGRSAGIVLNGVWTKLWDGSGNWIVKPFAEAEPGSPSMQGGQGTSDAIDNVRNLASRIFLPQGATQNPYGAPLGGGLSDGQMYDRAKAAALRQTGQAKGLGRQSTIGAGFTGGAPMVAPKSLIGGTA